MLLRLGSRTFRADAKGVRRIDQSLPAQIKARARIVAARGKVPKVQPPQFPRNAETSYASALLELLKVAHELVKEKVVPALDRIFAASANLTKADALEHRTDDYAEIINEVFADVTVEYERRTKRGRKSAASKAAKRVSDTGKRETGRYFKSLIGVDPTAEEPWLAPFVQLFTESNVGLIKSISDRYFGEVQDVVRKAAVTGQRPEGLADDIEERFGVSQSRAKLIARDQVGKFNGELTRVRQGRLGIKSFVWRTSMDERVRGNPNGKYPNAIPSHWALEGNTYEWQDPPKDTGIPGADYQCRCTAEPVLDDLADENTLSDE